MSHIPTQVNHNQKTTPYDLDATFNLSSMERSDLSFANYITQNYNPYLFNLFKMNTLTVFQHFLILSLDHLW